MTNHSATEFSATGMYSNEGRKMIYSVVSSTEAKVLIQKVMKADPHAFVNVVKTDIPYGPILSERELLKKWIRKFLIFLQDR